MKFTAMAVVTLLAMASSALADNPCKDKREAKHAAHKALHECIMSWAKDAKPGDADPGDDCGSKLSAFVAAAKDFKACRADQEAKKKK